VLLRFGSGSISRFQSGWVADDEAAAQVEKEEKEK
jgi:hypothetical protein